MKKASILLFLLLSVSCLYSGYEKQIDAVIFSDGTRQITAGNGDMALSSTQTVSGAKKWNSYSDFIGSTTFRAVQTSTLTVLSSMTVISASRFQSAVTVNAGVSATQLSASSFVTGESLIANGNSSGGSMIQIFDSDTISELAPNYAGIGFRYLPSDLGFPIVADGYIALKSSTDTVQKSWMAIGAGSVDATGTTDYFQVDVSTVGQAGKVEVIYGGLGQRVGGNIFTMTASSTSASSTAEVSLINVGTGTTSIPQGFWQVGKSLVIKGAGFYSSTTTTPGTFTLKVKIGSTVVLSTASVGYSVSQSSQVFAFSTTLTCRATGSSGSLMGQTAFFLYDTVLGLRALPSVNIVPVTVDLSADRDVSFTWQDSIVSTRNTKTLTNFTLDSK